MSFPPHFSEQLTQRALTVLREANVFSVEELVAYYHANSGFMHLASCGIKTDKELCNFAEELTAEMDSEKLEKIKRLPLAPGENKDAEPNAGDPEH